MVYLFLAEGFEEIEALTPVDVLRRAGVDVKTVGVTGERVRGSHGIEVASDISLDDAIAGLSANGAEIEMVILPGGMPGAKNLDESEGVDRFIKEALKQDAYIAAICAAPMILGKRGLLSGRDATCYPGFEKYLDGAKYYEASVVADGNFITADGMGSALDFALQLTALLKSDDESEKIADSIRA
ncbi:MAG: DJ-1/PfpI family protein [Clostridia bacterium]|nr:DJ-1/PfpI family protein [Clostridia bacterium]